MATYDFCELVVNLKVHFFGEDENNFVLKQDVIKAIDTYTYRFNNKEDLFNEVKAKILKRITDEYKRNYGLAPVDIKLGDKGIYVLKNGKKIQPLFSTVVINNKEVPLESVVLSRMFRGSLKVFYECDKRRTVNPNYQSFFLDITDETTARLELDNISSNDVVDFYQSISNKNRFFSAVRFLLMKVDDKIDMDVTYEIFERDIPQMEVSKTASVNNEEVKYYYRYPYIDE